MLRKFCTVLFCFLLILLFHRSIIHPAIVQLKGWGVHGTDGPVELAGQYFLVFEYIKGTTLT